VLRCPVLSGPRACLVLSRAVVGSRPLGLVVPAGPRSGRPSRDRRGGSVLDGRRVASRPGPGRSSSRIRSGHYSTVTTGVSTLLRAVSFRAAHPPTTRRPPIGLPGRGRGRTGFRPLSDPRRSARPRAFGVYRSERPAAPGRV